MIRVGGKHVNIPSINQCYSNLAAYQCRAGADNQELCVNPNDDHMSESEYNCVLFTLHYDVCSISISHGSHLGQTHFYFLLSFFIKFLSSLSSYLCQIQQPANRLFKQQSNLEVTHLYITILLYLYNFL